MDAAVAAERLEHSDGGALFHKTYRHLYEGEKRTQANRLQTLVLDALDDEGTADGEAPCEGRNQADSEDGRYWARTSDPQLVDRVQALAICRRLTQSQRFSSVLSWRRRPLSPRLPTPFFPESFRAYLWAARASGGADDVPATWRL
jgi:hypothetical protein